MPNYSVRAGQLRHVASYQTKSTTIDHLRQKTPVFTEVARFRVEVRSPSGRELLAAQQVQARVSHVIEHRWPGFIPSPRAVYVLEDGRILNIESATDPDNRRRRIISYCTEAIAPSGPTAL